MRNELDEALVRDFPNLYKQRRGSLMETAMCWGFECGDGWEPIIRELSAELEKEILKLPKENREYSCASQVKEKYGTLRFYMHSETDEMFWLIGEAENKSAITCEFCGQPGETRGHSWLSTICDECEVKHYLNKVISGLVASVKQVERENYKGEKVLVNEIEDKKENIDGMYINLKGFFIKEKKSFDFKFLADRITTYFFDIKYGITKSFKYPRFFIDDIKRSLKYKTWKLKRKINGLFRN